MKAALEAAVLAVAVSTADSLSCVQCTSWSGSCANHSAAECAADAESCVSSSANFSLGEFIRLYQDMSCSAQNCTGELSPFTVHVAAGEHFHFASQCCQGQTCKNDSDALAPAPGDGSSNAVCPACFGLNATSCSEKLHRCSGDQRCVHLEVEFNNGTELQSLLVKGCSDISNSTCHFLSTGNWTVGKMAFQQVECRDASLISTSSPTTASSASLKARLSSWALGSLLLLGLLL
uniref:LY6/PLAUR domain containing 8 n=1 Tax=Sciurus vulgaris TaxID=55149 RepID=A0A8D2CTA0_SCIVU